VDSARTEEYILKYLEARDHHKDSKVVKFFEAFERKKNYCMVFERVRDLKMRPAWAKLVRDPQEE
jgi:hypothetical protein